MKKILLLLLAVISLPAFVPPPKGKALPTFGQMIKQAEEHQEERRQKALQALPADLRREFLRINLKIGPILNIPGIAKEILKTARINRAFRLAINQPENMLTILKSLPKAGAVYLAEKLGKMPGIQSKQVQDWLHGIHLENGQELFEAIDTPVADPQIIASLLENPDIDVNWRNTGDIMIIALNTAVLYGHTEIVRLLIAAGANVNSIDAGGQTSLMRASAIGLAEIVTLLIAAGANVNSIDAGGQTSLMRASANGRAEVVRLLISARAQVNLKNIEGSTALIIASGQGNAQVVQLLLDAGAEVNAKDNDGRTALILASSMGFPEIVRLLLAAGADSTARAKRGYIALNAARVRVLDNPDRENDYKEVIKMLEDDMRRIMELYEDILGKRK